MGLLMTLDFSNGTQAGILWSLGSLWGKAFAFQTATNMSDWTTLLTLTNNGSMSVYNN